MVVVEFVPGVKRPLDGLAGLADRPGRQRQVAADLGANPFAFVLAVTFAASTAFMTPVGYQTNLFVYGPGGTGLPTTSASGRRYRWCSPS